MVKTSLKRSIFFISVLETREIKSLYFLFGSLRKKQLSNQILLLRWTIQYHLRYCISLCSIRSYACVCIRMAKCCLGNVSFTSSKQEGSWKNNPLIVLISIFAWPLFLNTETFFDWLYRTSQAKIFKWTGSDLWKDLKKNYNIF